MKCTQLFTCIGTIFLAGSLHAAAPSTQDAGQSDKADAERLTFLGNQLSADEAAIEAINKALVQAGYKAAVANDKAADAAKGNELMDRKGGGPARWQDFYGRTARDFIMHDKDSPVYHQVGRPNQFDYVYHANDAQIDAARAAIDALGQKQDALLERRKQLEAEQSALWAKIAFESIANREIRLRSLYRDRLVIDAAKADDNAPEPATVKALRCAVLYVRTADNAARSLDKKLDADQGACYAALRDALDENFQSLQEAEANFDDSSTDVTQMKQMSDVVSSAKTVSSLCTDLAEACHKAQDAEAAKEEGRRQLFRGTVQQSLFGLAEAVGRLDDQLEALSTSWGVKPKHGTLTADKVEEITIPPTPTARVAATPSQPTVTLPVQAATASLPTPSAGPGPMPQPKANAEGWMNLFNGKDLTGWRVFGNTKWTVEDGTIVARAQPNSHPGDQLVYVPREFSNFRLRVVTELSQGAGGVLLRTQPLPDWSAHYDVRLSVPGQAKSLPGSIIVGKQRPDLFDVQQPPNVAFNRWFTTEISANGAHLSVAIDGKTVADVIDPAKTYLKGGIGLHLTLMGAVMSVRLVQVKELVGGATGAAVDEAAIIKETAGSSPARPDHAQSTATPLAADNIRKDLEALRQKSDDFINARNGLTRHVRIGRAIQKAISDSNNGLTSEGGKQTFAEDIEDIQRRMKSTERAGNQTAADKSAAAELDALALQLRSELEAYHPVQAASGR